MLAPWRNGLLLAALFTSGFCGISYEVLYARLLGNHVGNQFAVNAAILVTFLLGIGLGARASHRLRGALWAVEWFVGAYAWAVANHQPWLARLLFDVTPNAPLSTQVSIVCGILVLPAIAIGASLPLFSDILHGILRERAFAVAYAVYNLGAAATSLVIEFLIIRSMGLVHAFDVIASLNGLVGAMLLVARPSSAPVEAGEPEAPMGWRDWVPLAVTSVASAIMQLLFLKVAEMAFGPYNENFAIVLFISLLGIALGSFWIRRSHWPLRTTLVAAVAGLLWMMAMNQRIFFGYAAYLASAHGPALVMWRILTFAAIMLPVAVAFGAAVPSVLAERRSTAQQAGRILAISSFANVAGYLLMVFWLHENLGYGQISTLCAWLLCLAWLVQAPIRKQRLARAGVAAVLAVTLLFTVWDERFYYGSYQDFKNVDALRVRLYSARDDHFFRRHDEVLAVRYQSGHPVYYINGYYAISPDEVTEHAFAAIATLPAPRLDRVLSIGLGTGATVGTLGQYFKHADCVELSALAVKHLDLFERYNFGMAHNPRITTVCDDALHYLKEPHQHYDLIVNNVSNPQYFSANKLWTTDFLDIVKANLTPDGVYTCWIGAAIGTECTEIILKTLQARFKHAWLCAINAGNYWLILCSDAPLALRQDGILERNAAVNAFFGAHRRSLAMTKYSVVSDDAYAMLPAGKQIPVATMDYPALEFALAKNNREMVSAPQALQNFVIRTYDPKRLQHSVFHDQPVDMRQVVDYFRSMMWITPMTDGLARIGGIQLPTDSELRDPRAWYLSTVPGYHKPYSPSNPTAVATPVPGRRGR